MLQLCFFKIHVSGSNVSHCLKDNEILSVVGWERAELIVISRGMSASESVVSPCCKYFKLIKSE